MRSLTTPRPPKSGINSHGTKTRAGPGRSELAIVNAREQEPDENPLDLGAERHLDAGVGEGLFQLQLEVLLPPPPNRLRIESDDRFQILRSKLPDDGGF